jgi:hypothetical protein
MSTGAKYSETIVVEEPGDPSLPTSFKVYIRRKKGTRKPDDTEGYSDRDYERSRNSHRVVVPEVTPYKVERYTLNATTGRKKERPIDQLERSLRFTPEKKIVTLSTRSAKRGNDLLQAIIDVSERIEMLDQKEKMMKPYGSLPYRPIAKRQRVSIANLIFACNDALREPRDYRIDNYPNTMVDPAEEKNLKIALMDMRNKLLHRLNPNDTSAYERYEKMLLDRRMEEVEQRINSLIDEVEMQREENSPAPHPSRQYEKTIKRTIVLPEQQFGNDPTPEPEPVPEIDEDELAAMHAEKELAERYKQINDKIRNIEKLIREIKKYERESKGTPQDNQRIREITFKTLEALDEIKDENKEEFEDDPDLKETFDKHDKKLNKLLRRLQQSDEIYRQNEEARRIQEAREQEARELRDFRMGATNRTQVVDEQRIIWEQKILHEIQELKKADENRRLPEPVRVHPTQQDALTEALNVVQSQRKKSISTLKSPEERPGELVQIVSLTQCVGAITVIKVIRESLLAVGYSSGDVAFYSLDENFRFLIKHREHSGSVTAFETGDISIDAEGTVMNREVLFSGGNEKDMTVIVWDTASLKPLKKLKGHNHMVTSIVDLRDSITIATGSMDSKVAFWDLREEEPLCIQIIEDMKFPIIVMEFDSDDGILSVGTLDGQIGLWQIYLENGEYIGCAMIKTLSLESHVLDILRTPGLPTSIITLESDFCVREYDIATGRLIKTVKGDKPLVDVFLIESTAGRGISLFALDHCAHLFRVKSWEDIPAKHQLPKGPEGEGFVKRYIGYNPRSQIYIKGMDLLMLSAQQSSQSLAVTRLNMN